MTEEGSKASTEKKLLCLLCVYDIFKISATIVY